MPKAIYLTFWIALSYVIGAQVGYLLELPGINITLLWPPSGIALAAVLMRGNLALPGIFLGVFVNLLIQLPSVPPGIMLSIILVNATATTFAALLAGKTLIRFAPTAPIWNSGADLLLGTVCIAIASTIPAFFGISIAFATGLLSVELVPMALSMWWLGEFCGMIIFTPLAFTVARRMSGKFWRKIKPDTIIAPTILYCCVALVAIISFLAIWTIESTKISEALKREATVAANSLALELSSNADYIVSIQAFFSSSEDISHEEFQRFVIAKYKGDEGYLAAQAIGWAPKVTSPRAWELEQLSMGNSSVKLFEVDSAGRKVSVAKRADYFPVEVMHPLNTVNRVAIGFDLGSEKLRRTALERARDTRETSMMAPIYLVQSEEKVPGMLICSAIYRTGATLETVADRRASLTGFASGVFYIGTIFEKALLEFSDDIDLHLFDTSLPAVEQWYHTKVSPFRTGPKAATPAPGLAGLKEGFNGIAKVHFLNQKWLVVATPGESYIKAQRTWTPWGALMLLLALGIVLSNIFIQKILAKKNIDTERAKTARALQDAQAANESKSYFMAAASHDIKQPLYALSMLTDTLLMTNPSEKTKPIVISLGQNIREMSQHFDTLMDVGRFHDGSFDVTASRVSLRDLARRVDLEIVPLCRAKGLDWNLDVDNVFVHTDAELLLRLIRNLLINAVRYTSDGEVSFSAKSQGRVVYFKISDTGEGLSPDQQELMFSETRLPKNRIHTSVHGLGLGLSIVNKVNQALDLGLQVSSSGEKGTVLTFRCKIDTYQVEDFTINANSRKQHD